MTIKADKKLFVSAGIIIILGLCILMVSVVRSLRMENAGLKTRQKELSTLRDEAVKLRDTIGFLEGKKSLTRVEGVVQAADEIFKSLGIGLKVKSVKPTGTKDRQFGTEEEAEIQLEKMNMNEMVNILYRVENSPMILSVKKTSIRTSFENPSLLNVTINISLIKTK
jgi:hypothetical protein